MNTDQEPSDFPKRETIEMIGNPSVQQSDIDSYRLSVKERDSLKHSQNGDKESTWNKGKS